MEPDKFSIPLNFFGPLDPELPELLGRVVMLSTLLELKLANLASSIDNGLQHSYVHANAADNLALCKGRLKLYGDNDAETSFVQRTRQLLAEIETALHDRNTIVHRIWPYASAQRWTGWKAKRRLNPADPSWVDWQDFTREWFVKLVAQLIKLIDETSDLVGFAGGIPRRADVPKPDPFDGLDRKTVLALGRLAWVAINLEDRASSVAAAVVGEQKRTPIGAFIDLAIAALGQLKTVEAKAASEWLANAKAGLKKRNEVLHSVPVTFWVKGASGPRDQGLTHLPNDGGPAITTLLTSEVLNEKADDLMEVQSGWMTAHSRATGTAT